MEGCVQVFKNTILFFWQIAVVNSCLHCLHQIVFHVSSSNLVYLLISVWRMSFTVAHGTAMVDVESLIERAPSFMLGSPSS